MPNKNRRNKNNSNYLAVLKLLLDPNKINFIFFLFLVNHLNPLTAFHFSKEQVVIMIRKLRTDFLLEVYSYHLLKAAPQKCPTHVYTYKEKQNEHENLLLFSVL